MTSRFRLLILSISTPLLVFAVLGGVLGQTATGQETYQHLRVFEDVISLITNNYVEDVELDQVMEGAMRGLAEGLDPESSYLTPDEVAVFERGPDAGAPADLGITLTRQYYLRVLSVRDGSPAAAAGLLPGDFIRGIDGQSTRDVSVFAGRRLLEGPAGSRVTLAVIRGSAAEPHDITITRAAPALPPVSGRIEAPGVGYVRIPGFGPDTASALAAEIDELKRAGATRLILDVRGVSEGDPALGIDAARLFVTSGVLGSREARDQTLESFEAKPGDGSVTLPVVILLNRGSSGPAEVLAAALEEDDRAEIIGEPTVGRAGEQKLVKLPDGSGLLMTAITFAGPDGEAIHGEGIEPDIEVEEPDIELGDTTPRPDPILRRAVEELAERAAA